MPVTINIADHAARSWREWKVPSAEELLRRSCLREWSFSAETTECKRIIGSSFSATAFEDSHLSTSENGFVRAAFRAYSDHHHLTFRPDDVWFAILSQLNFYINAHAEELRNIFVAHEGQKELVIKEIGSIETVDFGLFARRMTGLIQENVKDPDFRNWIMPTFSTTKVADRTTAAVLMLGSRQKYFSYKCQIMCGIPSVTLLGDREDWQDILQRLEKLSELGYEAGDFATLLRPILHNFIATFDNPENKSTCDFWAKIVHYSAGGSGPTYMSGWLTAFCFWNNDGKSLYHQVEKDVEQNERPLLKSRPMKKNWDWMADCEVKGCELEGVSFHTVDTNDIPNGFASVPVTVDDNGTIYLTKMVAGSIGIKALNSEKSTAMADSKDAGVAEELDSLRPVAGWFMYELNEREEQGD